jgi:hydrogenase maturation protein HypF
LARTVDRGDAPRYEGCTTYSWDGERDGAIRVLDPAALIAAMLDDLDAGAELALIAAGFHEAFGRATVELAREIAVMERLDTIVLTGGVFQNARLTEVVESGLLSHGLEVLVHAAIPPNDGGISVGQAAIAGFVSVA